MYNYIEGFMIVQIGLCLGYYLCALVYMSINIIDEKYIPIKTYLDKYPISPKQLDNSIKVDTSEKDTDTDTNTNYQSNKCVYEHTPNGGIFLRYNVDENIFEYWGDACIPYDILCVAVRKYCTLFCVQELYTDHVEEIEEEKKHIKEEDDDIFFTNFKPTAKNKHTENQSIHGQNKENEDQEKSKKQSEKHFIPKIKIKCNGAIRDFDILTKPTYVEEDSTEVISWSAYKKIQGNKT